MQKKNTNVSQYLSPNFFHLSSMWFRKSKQYTKIEAFLEQCITRQSRIILYGIALLLILFPFLTQLSAVPYVNDASAHLHKIWNIMQQIKDGCFPCAWSDGPFLGYAELYTFALPYMFTAILGSIIALSLAWKVSFVCSYLLLIFLTDYASREVIQDKKYAFYCTMLTLLLPNIYIFGVGAGSISRSFAYALFPATMLWGYNWLINAKQTSKWKYIICFACLYLSHPILAFQAGVISGIFIFLLPVSEWKNTLQKLCSAGAIVLGLIIWQLYPYLLHSPNMSTEILHDFSYF
jgi:uncharacterized membrane protein